MADRFTRIMINVLGWIFVVSVFPYLIFMGFSADMTAPIWAHELLGIGMSIFSVLAFITAARLKSQTNLSWREILFEKK